MPPLNFTIIDLTTHTTHLLAAGTLHVTCDERILTLVLFDMSHFDHSLSFGFFSFKNLLLLSFP